MSPSDNNQSLQQVVNQAAPLTPSSQFHGAQNGVAIPQVFNDTQKQPAHSNIPLLVWIIAVVLLLTATAWVVRRMKIARAEERA